MSSLGCTLLQGLLNQGIVLIPLDYSGEIRFDERVSHSSYVVRSARESTATTLGRRPVMATEPRRPAGIYLTVFSVEAFFYEALSSSILNMYICVYVYMFVLLSLV